MIDPHWDVADLDPVTWRTIGDYIRPTRYVRAGSPDEHALYVLHDEGRILNVVDSRFGRRTDIVVEPIRNPGQTAELLFGRGEWDRVHVIDKAHLQAVSDEAQSDPRHELTLDAYYRFVYQQYWDGEGGYVTSPPRSDSWNGWTWSGVQAWVGALPDPAVVGLGVIDSDGLSIGVIVVASDGLIRRVTTFEVLPVPRGDAEVSQAYCDRIWAGMGETIGPAAALLICTVEVFEAWLTGPDKQSAVDAGVSAGTAFVRY
ncbi:MAG TPA: hypothetical protein VIY86_11115 [Pirellulaceae bacterium]